MTRDELKQLPQEVHKQVKDAESSWNDFKNALRYSVRLIAYGPPGTGKSSAMCKIELNGRELERTSLTSETCWAEVRGHYAPSPQGLAWVDGPGVRAWRRGARLVIDEINEAGGDTIPGLHLLTDDNEIAGFTLPTGEFIRPLDDFQCFATMNVLPQNLPEALNDRFVVKRQISHPNPELLFSLPQEIRAAAAYSLYGNDPKVTRMPTRSWVEMGRIMRVWGLDVRGAAEVVLSISKAKDAALAINTAAVKVTNELAAVAETLV